MPFRRVALRLFAALVAVVHAFAPGTASIIDARPAAIAMIEGATAHVDAPGSPHTFAHQEQCALCGLAVHEAEPPAASHRPAPLVAPRPPRATQLATHAVNGVGATHSRAPPV
jgi:hypothetical protein